MIKYISLANYNYDYREIHQYGRCKFECSKGENRDSEGEGKI
jgi:hypothetical protein